MDFTYTYEQTMLRESVSRYLEKNYTFDRRQELVRSEGSFSPDTWRTFGELGLLALPFAEEDGGLGGSIVDLVAAVEPFGEHLVVEPYVASILLGGGVLARTGTPAARERLSRVIEGEALAAFAHEDGRRADLAPVRAVRSGDGYRLDGHKRTVLGGAEADVLVVSARLDDTQPEGGTTALFLVEPGAGVHITPFTTIDGRRAAHVAFDDLQVPAEHCLSSDADAVVTETLTETIIVLAAEAVGAMGALLRQTSEYAATRKQFGVPIGSFQTVAHRLADMKIAYTSAQATLVHTTALAEAGRATSRDVSVLKAQTGRLGRSIGEAAVQTHGGIGMTDELPIGHYLKRLVVLDTLFGDSDHHHRVVGAAG